MASADLHLKIRALKAEYAEKVAETKMVGDVKKIKGNLGDPVYREFLQKRAALRRPPGIE